jgi:hypothetical protein
MNRCWEKLARWSTLCLVVSHGANAAAQPDQSDKPTEPSDSATAAPSAPLDVVLLKDGGMVRGTIAEMVAGEQVTILTIAGQTRTFPMAEVEYAGPASKMPSQDPKSEPVPVKDARSTEGDGDKVRPLVTVHGKEAQLSLVGKSDGITFHRRSASAIGTGGTALGYDVMCTAPCEVSVPSGSYRLGLSRKGEVATEAEDDVVVPPGQSTIEGEYIDRSGTRTAGWIVFGVSVASFMVVPKLFETEECEDSPYSGRQCREVIPDTGWIVGTAVGAGGLVAATLMVMTRDKARISVSPGTPATPMDSARGTNSVSAELRRLQGATMTGTF